MGRMLFLVAVLATCVALAGCGGGSDDDGGTTSAQKAMPGNNGEVATIVMSENSFAPALMIVELGTKITWVNNDAVEHDVKSTAGEEVDSELLGQGESYSFTPTKAGAIEFVCTVHENMKARIQVEAPPEQE